MVRRGLSAAGQVGAGKVRPVPYTVSTPVFEGPFDLLLHLISRERVDLWEVSLSSIVDAYVATLEQMQAGLDLEVATEFLLIAAVLLELKTRRLLPGTDDGEAEEELALWEERDLLLARLLEAKAFKDASAALQRLMDGAGRSHPRTAGLEQAFVGLVPDIMVGVTSERLHSAMAAVLAPTPEPRVALDHVAPARLSVADAVAELVVSLPGMGRVTFAALTAPLTGRVEVIVRFLAVLELCKQGRVELEQADSLSDLHLWWSPAGADGGEVGAVEEYQG